MALRVFNVLKREKVDFVPITPGKINMYVCGPTVYDNSHLGHAKTYLSFDMVVRYLRYRGNDVLYVQNLTDVGHLLDTGEDRILKKARQASALPMQVVETYARSYFEDMDALGVTRPDISPRASGHIPEQIAMVETLIHKGHAYVADDGVYFDVGSYPEYGKLSNRRVEEGEAGSRALKGKGKRSAEDFALWILATEEHILQWDSPWGRGYPGWHIECSAMAGKYLGATFDLHGGGIDNIFPHNECEIAQSEAANDAPFANYWLLVGSLTVDGQKMSKSLGNFVTLKDALKRHRPEVIRYFIYQSHYSNPIDYSDGALEAAGSGWERMMTAVRFTRDKLRHPVAGVSPDAASIFLPVLEDYKAKFIEAMDDDFNAPNAIAILQSLTTEVNKLLNSAQPVGVEVLKAINDHYLELGGKVLGIVPEAESTSGADAARLEGVVRMLIEMRAQARKEKQFARADQIRDQLKDLGIVLEDRADGTFFRVE
ncbi:MAG: cysteine--tRNA ligase [Anaerolineae bacterium]|nr:cysteine--tRNA ligase [Anaerolineae bacterium]CAG0954518.1 cysteinyl-tRNA synthetase [Anaerolineae bacterium]